MTPQEAINRLNSTKEYLEEKYQEDVKNCKYPELRPLIKQTYEENIMGFNIAISALKKQIQKKVEYSEWYPDDKNCPHCGSNLTSYEKSVEHCPYCGQALDWSET